jgi:uncharacterized protein YgiM (DUF1202 family)
VRIRGLTEFTNRLLQASTEYGATHTLNGISGIPSDSLEIVLYAEDEVGNALEETLRIPVIDPQCTAIERMILREGPNEAFQQVGSIEPGSTVTVIAQDAGASWLRVLLPGNVRGWGERNLLTCADTFSVSDLQTEMNLPELPTALPSVAPTNVIAPTRRPTIPPPPTPSSGG